MKTTARRKVEGLWRPARQDDTRLGGKDLGDEHLRRLWKQRPAHHEGTRGEDPRDEDLGRPRRRRPARRDDTNGGRPKGEDLCTEKRHRRRLIQSGLGDTPARQKDIRSKGLKDTDLRIVKVPEMKTRALSEADEPCYRSSRRSQRPWMKKSRR